VISLVLEDELLMLYEFVHYLLEEIVVACSIFRRYFCSAKATTFLFRSYQSELIKSIFAPDVIEFGNLLHWSFSNYSIMEVIYYSYYNIITIYVNYKSIGPTIKMREKPGNLSSIN
jgi:hypothetical protein